MAKFKHFLWHVIVLGVVGAKELDKDRMSVKLPNDKEGSAQQQFSPGFGGIGQTTAQAASGSSFPQAQSPAIGYPQQQTPPVAAFPQSPPVAAVVAPVSSFQRPPSVSYPAQSPPAVTYPAQPPAVIAQSPPVVSYPAQSPPVMAYPAQSPVYSPQPYPQQMPVYPSTFYPPVAYRPPVYQQPISYPQYPLTSGYPADNFHMAADSGAACYVNGNPGTPCRGRCPPCWVRGASGMEDCYEKSPRTGMCSGLPGMRDRSYVMPQITPSLVRQKGCYRNGDRRLPCLPGTQCPPCWNVDYRDQAFQCFEYVSNAVGLCPPGLNAVNVRPLAYLPLEQNSDPEVVISEQSPSVCYINGNVRMPCSGNFCPPCWDFNMALNAYTCRDFIGSSMRCGGVDAIQGGSPATVDTFSMMIYSRPTYFRSATCYHGGMMNYPCQGVKCPVCWKFNFNTKRASCYARVLSFPGAAPACPTWDGVMDLARLGIFPPPSSDTINIAEETIPLLSQPPPPLIFPDIAPQYTPNPFTTPLVTPINPFVTPVAGPIINYLPNPLQQQQQPYPSSYPTYPSGYPKKMLRRHQHNFSIPLNVTSA